MQILQLIPALALGGAERMAVNLALNLQAQGHKVDLVSLCDPMGLVGQELYDLLSDSSVTTHGLGKRPGFDARMMMRVWRLLHHIKPDIIHTHLHASNYVIPFQALTSKPPVVHTVHNLALKEGQPIDRFLRKTLFRHRIQMVAIADEVHRTMSEVYDQPTFPIIPNGIPVDVYRQPIVSRQQWRQHHGFQSSDVLLVCIAKLMRQKRHDNLIDAFARANPSPHVHLLVAGDGPLRPDIETQIVNLGLSDRIHLLGQRTDIAEVLSASDLFVLASDWEGNPLAVMEAMAAGLPTITTHVGGVSELVADGQSGLLVPANDVPAFADSIHRLLLNPEQRLAMGQAGQTIARQDFSDRTMAQRYQDLYQGLLAAS